MPRKDDHTFEVERPGFFTANHKGYCALCIPTKSGAGRDKTGGSKGRKRKKTKGKKRSHRGLTNPCPVPEWLKLY